MVLEIMFYKDPCPKCGQPIARGRGVQDGRKRYHPDCFLCAHGVRMVGPDVCKRCESPVDSVEVEA